MRGNCLSSRRLRDHDDIAEHGRHHSNRRVAQPWRILSFGRREGAHRSRFVAFGIKPRAPPDRTAVSVAIAVG